QPGLVIGLVTWVTVSGRRKRRPDLLPYVMVLPAAAIFLAVLAYPLLRLAELSLQHYGLRELFTRTTRWVGLDNYAAVLGDRFFWTVVARTVAFTAANVVLTIVVGMLVALLLARIGR